MATKIGSFFSELKRRNVFKVAVAYGIVGWLLVQAASIVLPSLGLPQWTVTLVIVLLAIAFPVALILAWAYELTPQGLRPTPLSAEALPGAMSSEVLPSPEPVTPTVAAAARAAAAPTAAAAAAATTAPTATAAAGAPPAAAAAPAAAAPTAAAAAPAFPAARAAPAPALEHLTRPPPLRSALASIAVLQFENLTPQAPHAYLADTLSVELHSSLSRVHQLRVVSRQSAAAHAGSALDLKALAAQLEVQYLVSGTVAEFDGKIQVNVELDDALEDALLWSERYDVAVEAAGDMQREIAEQVASVFGGERLRAEIAHAEHAPADAAAWQLVQKARAYLVDYKPETVLAAIPLLRRAVEIDPRYAVAHAALGLVTAEMTLNALSADADADRRVAIDAVSQAEQLAPRDPVVLRAAGCVRAYTGACAEALELLRRAVKLAPYDLGTWGYMGWPLVATGEPEDLGELHGIVDRLLALSPQHPGHAYWLFHKSVAFTCEDRCEEAASCARECLDEQPRFALGWMHYANVLGRLGDAEGARSAAARAAAISAGMTSAYYVSLMGVLSNRPAVVEGRTSGLRAAGCA